LGDDCALAHCFLEAFMIFLRSLLFNIVFYLNTSFFMLGFLFLFLLPRDWGMFSARLWAKTSIWWLKVIAGTDFEVRGRENLPKGSYILASKHQSAFETFALLLMVEDPVYILKKELMFVPFFGWYLKKFQMIPVDRGKGRKAIEDFMPKVLKSFARGRQLLIYPEGTRTSPGAAAKYKIGVGHIYERGGVPCVPMALNAGCYWSRQSFLRHKGTIVFEVLPAIEPGLSITDFMIRLENDIETASNALIVEANQRDGRPLPQGFIQH
jgi:1-acyl-sn-glycerol-3-phosphate acyltransferase